MENLAPTWIRSSDRQARSHSLYRLSYRAHLFGIVAVNLNVDFVCLALRNLCVGKLYSGSTADRVATAVMGEPTLFRFLCTYRAVL